MIGNNGLSTSGSDSTASRHAIEKSLKYIDPAVEKSNRLKSVLRLTEW